MNAIMLVVITANPPEKGLKRFVKRFPNVEFSTSLSDILRADVIFGWLIDKKAVSLLKNLKWFHTAGIQYEGVLPRELFKKAVVTNSRGVWADYIVGSFFKPLLKKFSPGSLKGKTAGIVGLGGNGRACAKEAIRYKMRVVATTKPDIRPRRGLNDVISASDIIFVTVPLTKETKGLLGRREFAKMKDGTCVLSASRPDVIDKRALKAALSAGKIKLAVLDDLWPEEIKRLKGVFIFPHASPFYYNVWPKMFETFAKNLDLFIKGKTLINRITS